MKEVFASSSCIKPNVLNASLKSFIFSMIIDLIISQNIILQIILKQIHCQTSNEINLQANSKSNLSSILFFSMLKFISRMLYLSRAKVFFLNDINIDKSLAVING